MERLAMGVRHCPTVTVAKLNATDPDTRAFLTAAFSGLTDRLPAVLLYPEAATGYVRLKGRTASAEDIVRGINKLYDMILPTRPALELRDLAEADLAEIVYGGTAGLERQRKRGELVRLMEEVAAAREAAAAAAVADGGPATLDGAVDGGQVAGQDRDRTAEAVLAAPSAPAAAKGAQSGYWTGGKAVLWGAVAALSVFALAWDLWLAAAWDRWQLERRQRKRARGVRFSKDQDLEDLGTILYDQIEEGVVVLTPPQQQGTQALGQGGRGGVAAGASADTGTRHRGPGPGSAGSGADGGTNGSSGRGGAWE